MFKDDGSYSENAVDLARKMEQALLPLYQEFASKGHTTREIAYVMLDSVHLTELQHRVLSKRKSDGQAH